MQSKQNRIFGINRLVFKLQNAIASLRIYLWRMRQSPDAIRLGPSIKIVSAKKGRPRVLMATSTGCYEHAVIIESTLAVALSLRGAVVDALLCDRVLPCCQMIKIANTKAQLLHSGLQPARCRSCYENGRSAYGRVGVQALRYRDKISAKERKIAEEVATSLEYRALAEYRHDGIAVGEHAYAGALRYFARGNLWNEPLSESVLRKYLFASMLSLFAIRRILCDEAYTVVVAHHGIYVPQGIIGEVCRQTGVHIVNWNPAYRKHSFVFSHGDSYHHTMIDEPTSTWENMEWNSSREKEIDDYLKSRWRGTEDWIWFHEGGIEASDAIALETGVDFRKPCIGLLTSVMWDAQLHYKSNAFPHMLDWVLKTIQYFQQRTELQLMIRIHPAEISGMIPSRQKMKDEIDRAFPKLPANVFIIPPESRISTYAAMQRCSAVIIYNTKAGIEISCMGIPVIVAGEAWIRNKGFSIDAGSPEDYYEILDRLPFATGLSTNQLLLAKKYAYHFFFRRMIKLPFVRSREKGRFELDLTSSEDLLPGRFEGLDVICDGILNGSPFVTG